MTEHKGLDPRMLIGMLDRVVAGYREQMDAEVVRLVDEEELSFREAGELLGVSKQAAWKRYTRVKTQKGGNS